MSGSFIADNGFPAQYPPKTVRYVAGLLFDDTGSRVALVRKNRPAWQAGKLNAIGGKIEAGESPGIAMMREFEEETGVHIPPNLWSPIAVLTGDTFQVHFFSARSHMIDDVQTMEDETIERHEVGGKWGVLTHPHDLIPNLRVIIPLALDNTGIVKPVALRDSRPVTA